MENLLKVAFFGLVISLTGSPAIAASNGINQDASEKAVVMEVTTPEPSDPSYRGSGR